MNKRKISGELAFEVTQNCNLECLHCLRGCKRNVNMTKEIVDATLDNYQQIDSILFTGGEPTLNIDIIKYIIEQVQIRNISVGRFYIVTNATFYSPDLVLALLDLYVYCDDCDKISGLCVSIDSYHSQLDKDALQKYKALSFYRSDKEWADEGNRVLIDRGNASLYVPFAQQREIERLDLAALEVDNDTIYTGDNIIYINAEGYVYYDCDLSYDMQDELKDINVLNTNLSEWLYSLANINAQKAG